MGETLAFVYSPEYLRYDFSDGHPFNPLRLQLTYDLLTACGVLLNGEVFQPRMATIKELKTVHSPEYIEAVHCAGSGGGCEPDRFGLGTEDNPVFEEMHAAAALIVGGTLTAVDLVVEGKAKHAVNIAGGLHHAQRDRASGFCIYNDAAIAITHLRQDLGLRVLYVDTDAHHGDGVQEAFYDDPDVEVISLHETGHFLFPGTGDIHEQGSGRGFGHTINLPVQPFTEDQSWIETFENIVVPTARAFAPDIIVSQNGCDGHYLDPLTHLSLTMRSYEEIPRLVHELAETLCEGRLICLGGGGYNIWQVVPRAWANLWSKVSGRELGDEIPAKWLEKWEKVAGVELPGTFADPRDLVPPVPRRADINEINEIMVNRVLRQVHLLL